MIYTELEYDNKTYEVRFSQAYIDLFKKYCTGGSYHTILYRLFGLLPQDFYHYIQQTYNASFAPSPYLKIYIKTQFVHKQDAINFAAEIERRIKYFIERGDLK